ncbi:Uncharacterised protein [Pseudomonas aeruginosa]|nr:Uncharacterised protein [Pseudomonas aeruginosa]
MTPSPARAILGIEHHKRQPRTPQKVRGGQRGLAAADDDYIPTYFQGELPLRDSKQTDCAV